VITLFPADAAAGRELGAVIALHGAGSSAAGLADQLAVAMTAASTTTFAVICVDGGGTYWHRRANGDDPLGMIIHEVLPRAAAAGLVTRRIGITGESMGGYGALLLAQRMAAHDVAAAAALSPAIFASYMAARSADAAAFDSEQDFAKNDVFAGISALRHVPTWVACGIDDPFQPEAALFRARLTALTGHQVPGGILGGCHDEAFWLRHLPAALHFIGGHLG
jgi:dipeptidyl aminopeptidase/acylaminoacyl peptidase